MLINIFIFVVALYMIIKGSTMATIHAGRLAESFRLSKYTVGFIIIAIFSILPEAFVVINSAIKGIPSFGLGLLFGSNIADLTLIFAIIIYYTGRSLKIESKILKNRSVYPFVLLLPLILGIDGDYTRLDGLALILAGAIFYYIALKDETNGTAILTKEHGKCKNSLMLILSMAILLVGAHFIVTSTASIAQNWGISPVLIGMLIVGLGTTMPELFFSIQSVKKNEDSLAVGDLLGIVLADATVVIGILALISPFSFPQKIIYVTGSFMVAASFILFYFMRSGKALTKKEANLLLFFWLIFVLVEFIVNT